MQSTGLYRPFKITGLGGDGESGSTASGSTVSSASSTSETCAPEQWSGQLASVGISVSLALLTPLLIVKTAQSLYPIRTCAQSSSSTEACEQHAREQTDYQYVTVLVLAVMGVLLAMFLARRRSTSPAALMALFNGCMIAIVYDVYTNYNRLTDFAQMSIIALLCVSLLFLPRVAKHLLV
jgi:hypothetical protein